MFRLAARAGAKVGQAQTLSAVRIFTPYLLFVLLIFYRYRNFCGVWLSTSREVVALVCPVCAWFFLFFCLGTTKALLDLSSTQGQKACGFCFSSFPTSVFLPFLWTGFLFLASSKESFRPRSLSCERKNQLLSTSMQLFIFLCTHPALPSNKQPPRFIHFTDISPFSFSLFSFPILFFFFFFLVLSFLSLTEPLSRFRQMPIHWHQGKTDKYVCV